MKKISCILIFLIVLIFSGCSARKSQVTKLDSTSNSQYDNDQNNTQANNEAKNTYYLDVTKEWDESEYKRIFSQELNYFTSPIQSPHKYTYKCESKDMTINDIATKLGAIMMEDFMRDYEGKTFVVTEYRNLLAHVMNEDEIINWKERFSKTGKDVVIENNQWLCNFDCEYKYSGIYAGIGEMPKDWEWMNGLIMDGSGENYVFIIQKVSEDEYIMRAMPKTVMEEIRINQ